MRGGLSSFVESAWREDLLAIGALQRENAAREWTFRWIVAILCATVFEGGLRKWVLSPEYAPLAYVAKDAIGLAFIFTHPILPRFRNVCRTRVLFGAVGVVLFYPLFVGLQLAGGGGLEVQERGAMAADRAAHGGQCRFEDPGSDHSRPLAPERRHGGARGRAIRVVAGRIRE